MTFSRSDSESEAEPVNECTWIQGLWCAQVALASLISKARCTQSFWAWSPSIS